MNVNTAKKVRRIDPEFLRIVVALTVIALVAALVLALVYNFTVKTVDRTAELESSVNGLIAEVYPGAEVSGRLDVAGYTAPVADTGIDYAFAATNGAKVIVATAHQNAKQCYKADGISLFVVIKDGKIDFVKLYSSAETPGLGANATKASYLEQFVGIDVGTVTAAENYYDAHTVAGSEISKVTGATRSTNGVYAAVRAAAFYYTEAQNA